MIRKISSVLAAAVMAATLAVSAFAAGPVTGKVTKVDGDKVTVAVEGAVPAWAKKGTTVNAAGGAPKIVAVEGNQVTLKMSKAKAAKIAVDSTVTMSESEGDELQGC